MKLSLLLIILGFKLYLTGIFSEKFRKMVRKKDFTLTIRSADHRQARTYNFEKGKIRSGKGEDENADTVLIWKDAATAVRVMLSKNELDGFSAIGNTNLRIAGNFEYALWFMELAE